MGESREKAVGEPRVVRRVVAPHDLALLEQGVAEARVHEGQPRLPQSLTHRLRDVVAGDGRHLGALTIDHVRRHGVGAGQATELATDQPQRAGEIAGGAEDSCDGHQRGHLADPGVERAAAGFELLALPARLVLSASLLEHSRGLPDETRHTLPLGRRQLDRSPGVERQDPEEPPVNHQRCAGEARKTVTLAPVVSDKTGIAEDVGNLERRAVGGDPSHGADTVRERHQREARGALAERRGHAQRASAFVGRPQRDEGDAGQRREVARDVLQRRLRLGQEVRAGRLDTHAVAQRAATRSARRAASHPPATAAASVSAMPTAIVAASGCT